MGRFPISFACCFANRAAHFGGEPGRARVALRLGSCSSSADRACAVRARGVASVARDAPSSRTADDVKPFDQIPGPLCLPIFGNLLHYRLGIFSQPEYHKVLRRLHAEYGPICRQKLGPSTIVHCFDPDDIRTVYQNEGKMPVVPPLQETTQLYRQQRGMSPGLGNTNGEEWYRLRSAIQQMMMRPKEVRHFLPLVSKVADDFAEHLGDLIDVSSDGKVGNLRDEIAKWSLESSAMTCFEKRLGCFHGGEGELWAEKMINANKEIFRLSGLLKFSLPIYRRFPTPKWRELVKHEDFFYAEASDLLRRTLSVIDEAVRFNKLKDGSFAFLSYVLARKELNQKDVFILTLSLFADGLSTTTPAALYNLYCIAANPEAQEKLRAEIRSRVEGDVTPEVIDNMPYLKACVKEAFRLYPVGTEVSREIQQDLVLSGYRVPAGTHVDLCPSVHFLSEEHFEDAEKFVPERWLRDKKGAPRANAHPYLLTPFGVGTRMCAGRRFAEQDLYLLLIKLLQKFKLSNPSGETLGQHYLTLLFPDKPLKVSFQRLVEPKVL